MDAQSSDTRTWHERTLDRIDGIINDIRDVRNNQGDPETSRRFSIAITELETAYLFIDRDMVVKSGRKQEVPEVPEINSSENIGEVATTEAQQ